MALTDYKYGPNEPAACEKQNGVRGVLVGSTAGAIKASDQLEEILAQIRGAAVAPDSEKYADSMEGDGARLRQIVARLQLQIQELAEKLGTR